MRLFLVGVMVTALLALAAAPAMAANQLVTIGDDFFNQARVAVAPGESVTWTNPGTSDHHNVRFEDNAFTQPGAPMNGPYTTPPRVFQTPGTFRYYCEEHGAPGGEGMSGVVYVNADVKLGPVAALEATPNPAQVGQSVTFSGAGSTVTNGSIVKYEWDLDGNTSNGFEINTGTTPTASRSYASAQTVNVTLRVTDSGGTTDQKTKTVAVDAPPPPPPPPPPDPQPVPKPPAKPAPKPPPLVSATPTLAQIATALGQDASAAAKVLKRLGLKKLLRQKGFTVRGFDARAAGTLKVTATAPTRSARGARAAAGAVTVASARRRFLAAGSYEVKVKLTKAGRRLLRKARRASIKLSFTFTDSMGRSTSKVRKASVKR